MMLSKTNEQELLRLLIKAALIINERCDKPSEQDVARRLRLMVKTINRNGKDEQIRKM